MPTRVPCTCGCGLEVTYATKINHLNGRGKTSLRARVLEENESLKQPSMRQQPVLRQKRKRSHPSSNQTGSRKRLKGDQLDVDLPAQAYAESLPTPAPNQGPESPISQVPENPLVQASTDITESTPTLVPNQAPDGSPASQADADLPPALEPDSGIEDGSADTLSSARRSNRIAERTMDITEQRWGNNHLQDEIPISDLLGGGNRSDDEEDVFMNMTGDEDSDDEEREEEDDDLFAESGVAGISAWDLLGEGFEREAASIGMFLAHVSSVLLTIV